MTTSWRKWYDNPENKRSHLRRTARNNKLKYNENRRKIYEYLSQHSCIDCGESDPIVLEFDHRDGEDKVECVSNLLYRFKRWESILKEIEKCEVRCANCHRRRTAKTQGWYENVGL